MYVGWNYHGFARQTDTDNTIEGVLFPTLKHVKLITEDHYEDTSLGYSRCGRTDKGVSAMGQVMGCMVGGRVLATQLVLRWREGGAVEGVGRHWCF
jgi:tRNA pseudouridine38/39 synthase